MPVAVPEPGVDERDPHEAFAKLADETRVDIPRAVAEYDSGDAPIRGDPWVGAVVLLAWFAIPLAIGYRRFSRTDL